MTRAFFDTNVVIYAVGAQETLKQSVALDLMQRHSADGSIVMSTQVLLETFNVLTRKHRLIATDALELVRTLATRTIVAASTEVVLQALHLAERHKLSPWDAAIVQAALDAGCEALYTEDLQTGRRFGDLEVVNPFLPAAHEPSPAFAAAPRAPASTGRPRPARRLPSNPLPSKRKKTP